VVLLFSAGECTWTRKNDVKVAIKGKKHRQGRRFAQKMRTLFGRTTKKKGNAGFILAKKGWNVYHSIQQGTGIVSRTPQIHKEEIKK